MFQSVTSPTSSLLHLFFSIINKRFLSNYVKLLLAVNIMFQMYNSGSSSVKVHVFCFYLTFMLIHLFASCN